MVLVLVKVTFICNKQFTGLKVSQYFCLNKSHIFWLIVSPLQFHITTCDYPSGLQNLIMMTNETDLLCSILHFATGSFHAKRPDFS